MIFSGDKSGHPWHGLWSDATGQITTPDAVTIDLPGEEPSGLFSDSGSELPPGDAFKIAIPDQPAVTTTPEETADGKTWLNYGIISGPCHRLYGVNLGFNRWLYVDPNKTVWMCTLIYVPSDGDVSVTFTRFGNFLADAEPDEVTIEESHGSGMGAVAKWIIDDISPTGDTVLVTLYDIPQTPFSEVYTPLSGGRNCKGGIKIEISGAPPDATLTVTVMVLPDDVTTTEHSDSRAIHFGFYRSSAYGMDAPIDDFASDSISWSYPNTPPSDPDPPGYDPDTENPWRIWNADTERTFEDAETTMIGLAFDGTGSACVVSVRLSWSSTTSFTLSPHVETGNDPSDSYYYDRDTTVSDTYSCQIKFGDDVAGEITGSFSLVLETVNLPIETHGTPLGWSHDYTSSYDFFGQTGTCQAGFSDIDPEPFYLGFEPVFSGAYCEGLELDTDTNYLTAKLFRLFISRLGNGLFGAVVTTSADNFSTVSSVNYNGVASRSGFDSGVTTTGAIGEHFATCHPVTGVITRSSTPVCVV